MFKVNNKDTRTMSIVNFEHVIAGWEDLMTYVRPISTL